MRSWGRGICPFPSPKATPIIIFYDSSNHSMGEGTLRHKVDFFCGLEEGTSPRLLHL